MQRPVIGIISTRIPSAHGYPLLTLAEAYAQAVATAGGLPLIIPLGEPEGAAPRMLSRLDGVLFSGGGDVHPERYGSSMHPKVSEIDLDRDRVEIEMIAAILDAGLPFFGICRGLQMINVALGGGLYEDLLDQHEGSLEHAWFPRMPRNYLAHPVRLLPGSRIAQAVGCAELLVNSSHHQGIRRLAPRLAATAWAPDGLIEAIELADYPFGLAVQWHPEWLTHQPETSKLWQAFIQAASQTA